MATIHSLAHELIRHTLSFAYPPGTPHSGRGLGRTALVHSSWKEPSTSIMTEELEFDVNDQRATDLFIRSGPAEFSCRRLVSRWCETDEAEAILAKAKSGGIHELQLF